MAEQIEATKPRAPFLWELHVMRKRPQNLSDKPPNIAREPDFSAFSSFWVWGIWPLLDALSILPPSWNLKEVSVPFREELHWSREEAGPFFNNSPCLSNSQGSLWTRRHYLFTSIVLQSKVAAKSPWRQGFLGHSPSSAVNKVGHICNHPSFLICTWHVFIPPSCVSWKNFQYNLPDWEKGGKNSQTAKQPGSQKLPTVAPNTLNDGCMMWGYYLRKKRCPDGLSVRWKVCLNHR